MFSNVETKPAIEVRAIEYHHEVNVAVEPITSTKINEVHEDECESADEIDEDQFKGKLMPEKNMQELTVNFVLVKNPVAREEEFVANLDQDFSNVERMIKSVFPQLLADNSQLGLALKCVHEINSKSSTNRSNKRLDAFQST